MDEKSVRKTINIAISLSVWETLNAMKKAGESFDSVLRRIISVTKEASDV